MTHIVIDGFRCRIDQNHEHVLLNGNNYRVTMADDRAVQVEAIHLVRRPSLVSRRAQFPTKLVATRLNLGASTAQRVSKIACQQRGILASAS